VLQKKFDPTINFDLMINFGLFWPNKLGFPWYEREICFLDLS